MTDPSRPRRVMITAAGVISPLGLGLDETAEALRAGRDAVTGVTAFDVSRTRCSQAGQVRNLPALTREVAGENPDRLHRAGRMTIAAVREVQEADPGFNPELAVIGTTSGGMTFGETFFRIAPAESLAKKSAPRFCWRITPPRSRCSMPALRRTAGFSAPSQIIANACASGTNAIGHALRSSDRANASACCAADTMRFPNWSLSASIRSRPRPPEKCRPFDKERTGLVLGEGAALLALEDLRRATERGRADPREDRRLRNFDRQLSSHPAASVGKARIWRWSAP